MDFIRLVSSLNRFPRILSPLVCSVANEDARWKPTGQWSILEIVCHLADEEVEDFRPRLHLTLDDPLASWPPIDPEAAAIDREYNKQDLPKTLERFVGERQLSVDWLRTLENPDWERAYEHPDNGPISAGSIMASWAAHDQLHLRQITKRLFEMNVRDAAPFSTNYAGEW